MRAMKMILMLCLGVLLSGCPAVTHSVNNSVAEPTKMGEACSGMGVAGTPTKIEGLTKLDPKPDDKGCVARYRCDAPAGSSCLMEMTSGAFEANAALAFVVDAKSNDASGLGPSSAGTPPPPMNMLEIQLGPPGFFGVGDSGSLDITRVLKPLAGHHYARAWAVRAVGDGKQHGKMITAILLVRPGTYLGEFGFRRAYCAPGSPGC